MGTGTGTGAKKLKETGLRSRRTEASSRDGVRSLASVRFGEVGGWVNVEDGGSSRSVKEGL